MSMQFNWLTAFIKRNPFTTGLIVVAAVLQLAIILPSGIHYCFNKICGDFLGVNEYDAM